MNGMTLAGRGTAWLRDRSFQTFSARFSRTLSGGLLVLPLLAGGVLTQAGIVEWSRLNSVFHRTIVGSIDSPVVADAIARNHAVPLFLLSLATVPNLGPGGIALLDPLKAALKPGTWKWPSVPWRTRYAPVS